MTKSKHHGGWGNLTPEQREERVKKASEARRRNQEAKRQQQSIVAQERVLNAVEMPLHAVVTASVAGTHYNNNATVDIDKLAALLVAVAKHL